MLVKKKIDYSFSPRGWLSDYSFLLDDSNILSCLFSVKFYFDIILIIQNILIDYSFFLDCLYISKLFLFCQVLFLK